MSDYRQLIQQKLDGELAGEREEELQDVLQRDQEAAEESAKLEQVHDKLRHAPHMRAPSHLAATIMARLAQTIEAQAQLKPLPLEVRSALMMSLSMVQFVMMPMMLAASYMVVNAMASPQILIRVMQRTIALQLMMIRSLIVLLEEIEVMIKKDPDMAPVAMSLVPVALKGMLGYLELETSHMQPDIADEE